MTRSPRQLARLCAEVAADKKAEDIVVLDIGPVSSIADYFVIASGLSPRQLQAIAYELETKLKPLGYRRLGLEGYETGRWVLVDYGDVVVHLFLKDVRDHYELESNWGDAQRVDIAQLADDAPASGSTPPARATGN